MVRAIADSTQGRVKQKKQCFDLLVLTASNRLVNGKRSHGVDKGLAAVCCWERASCLARVQGRGALVCRPMFAVTAIGVEPVTSGLWQTAAARVPIGWPQHEWSADQPCELLGGRQRGRAMGAADTETVSRRCPPRTVPHPSSSSFPHHQLCHPLCHHAREEHFEILIHIVCEHAIAWSQCGAS